MGCHYYKICYHSLPIRVGFVWAVVLDYNSWFRRRYLSSTVSD
jgi:hypothetical protein